MSNRRNPSKQPVPVTTTTTTFLNAISKRTSVLIRFSTVAIAALFSGLSGTGAPALAAPVNNIVLVHGAWVDASGWKSVYEILTKDGYAVTIVQEPLTSLQDDVAATNRSLDLQSGPCILVGHSYGGSIITEAGIHPNVVGLVYVAAHAPDVGESEGALGTGTPSATQEQPGAIQTTADGFTFRNPADFYQDFAADLPRDQPTSSRDHRS
jgi:pimeloyl-ACP methyl ester carboxylesterase